jgi:hypothetical protein
MLKSHGPDASSSGPLPTSDAKVGGELAGQMNAEKLRRVVKYPMKQSPDTVVRLMPWQLEYLG